MLTTLYGLILLFAGRFIMKVVVSLGVGFLAGYLAYLTGLRLGFGVLGSLVVFLLVFPLASLAGWYVFKLALSLVASTPIWLVSLKLLGFSRSELPAILLLVLLVVVFYMVSETLVTIVAVIGGLVMIYTGVSSLVNPAVALIVVLLAMVLRAYLYTVSKW